MEIPKRMVDVVVSPVFSSPSPEGEKITNGYPISVRSYSQPVDQSPKLEPGRLARIISAGHEITDDDRRYLAMLAEFERGAPC